MSTHDAIVIGAGHNGLATAIVLARAGWDVCVLERGAVAGGAVQTAEVTLPGFRHDLYATNLNLLVGSPFFADVGPQLMERGFEIAGAARPFGSAFPDGTFLGVSTDPAETHAAIAALSEADAQSWDELGAWFGKVAPLMFGVLGAQVPSVAALRGLWAERGPLRTEGQELARLVLQAPRELVEERFASREVQALMASWGLHMDFSPDIPGGAVFALLETFASAQHGMALARGGSGNAIAAMVSLLEDLGGTLRTECEVEQVLVSGGRATGVRLRGGERMTASRAVVANLTPRVLFGSLLSDGGIEDGVRRLAARYRYGPGTLMLHLAVDDLPRWRAGDHVREHAYVHVGPYMEDMALGYAQAMAGLLPAHPTIVVGQPTAIDPSRAPAGKHILWIQVRVVPGTIRGDAAGRITDTDWDAAAEPYADRVLELLEPYAPGLSGQILGRHVISPAALERDNPNLVGGDHLGGSLHPFQNFALRPFPGWSRYRTPVDQLYMCGSATWPGPGVGAGSGYLLGRELTDPGPATALRRRLDPRRRPARPDSTPVPS